jgi:phage shock protein A
MSNENYAQLKREHDKLKAEHEQLQTDYEQLNLEFQENTIIQSMNSMKDRYEHLVNSTVPSYKYDLMKEKASKMRKTMIGAQVILAHSIVKLLQLEAYITMEERKELFRLKNEINIVIDILEDE